MKQLIPAQPQDDTPTANPRRREVIYLFNNFGSVVSSIFLYPIDPVKLAELSLEIDRAIREPPAPQLKAEQTRESQMQMAHHPLLSSFHTVTLVVVDITNRKAGP